ncbi:MAG: MBL fold metallo-hydrolase [Solirubrobacterales bacterium]|nr:MBL fold metallo-hydrolase [Solirubrobacterales bacterium]
MARVNGPHRISRFGLVNAYLVEEDDGLTLVDTAIPRSAKALLEAAQELGKPIVRVVLSHAHGDHVGSLDAIREAIPRVEVSISARESRLLRVDKSLDPGEPEGKLRGSYPGVRSTPDRLLEPGDRVGSLEAHAAPGHTPGQLAFLDVRDRSLYCGDAFSTLGGVATSAKPNPRFPLPALSTWHRPTALRSAGRLRALEPTRLAPGHGKVIEGPGAAMDAAISRGS